MRRARPARMHRCCDAEEVHDVGATVVEIHRVISVARGCRRCVRPRRVTTGGRAPVHRNFPCPGVASFWSVTTMGHANAIAPANGHCSETPINALWMLSGWARAFWHDGIDWPFRV
jgi:hypothetical protein